MELLIISLGAGAYTLQASHTFDSLTGGQLFHVASPYVDYRGITATLYLFFHLEST